MNFKHFLWFFVLDLAIDLAPKCASHKVIDLPTNPTTNIINESFTQIDPKFYHLNTKPKWQEKRVDLRDEVKGPCSCLELNCGCCAGMQFRRFKRKLCSNFTYDPNEFQVQLDVMNNDNVLYQNMFSAKNPPPMCLPIPYTPATMCIKLYNIFTPGRNLHMCMDMEGKVQDKPYVILHFDCMRMGQDGFKYPLKPEANGGEVGMGGGGGGGGIFGLFGNRPSPAPAVSTTASINVAVTNEVTVSTTEIPQIDIDTFDPITEIKI